MQDCEGYGELGRHAFALSALTATACSPNTRHAQLHDRVPLILEPDTWDAGLNAEPETAAALMKPANEDALVSRPVSKAVGNVRNNGPELLA